MVKGEDELRYLDPFNHLTENQSPFVMGPDAAILSFEVVRAAPKLDLVVYFNGFTVFICWIENDRGSHIQN